MPESPRGIHSGALEPRDDGVVRACLSPCQADAWTVARLPCGGDAISISLSREKAERPGMKRGKFRDNAVYLILDLFGALGERRNVFLPDVILDPVSRLRPMPGVANALDSFLPIWLVAGLFQGIRELRKQTDAVSRDISSTF